MTTPLLRRVVVPIANENDAERTCSALQDALGDADARIHVVHVIEKAGGALDKAPMEAREKQAKEIFEFVTAYFSATDYEVETALRYGTDTADEIIGAAVDADASAIAFAPRTAGRLSKLLSGNLTTRLVETDRVPVLVLPRKKTEE